MSKVAINKPVPDFTLQATDGKTFQLSDLQGKNVVIYFYPKDNTPGCTLEGEDFRDAHAQFAKHHTVIVGISRDSVKSHDNFKCKFAFPFDLLSDSDEKVCQLFDVIKEKNMYGKKVMGIQRSTFLIDKEGILRAEWRGVKVPEHVEEVLARVKALAK
jgi:peroxiredoxin Q/BCP